jgi:uncharacterized membrane protein YoaK (UPF0700 family)
MIRFDCRIRLLAACLSALAGYVAAVAFLKLGGFFVSFISGNFTRRGVGLPRWSAHARGAGGLIAATFVAGVSIGSLSGAAPAAGGAGAGQRLAG